MRKQLLSWMPVISNRTKIIITTLLLMLSIVSCVLRQGSVDSKICVMAMGCSFMGDILLNCTPLEKRSHSLLYSGAICFMIAHIIYAMAYYGLITEMQLNFFNKGAFCALVIMVIFFGLAIICIKMTNIKLKPMMICIFLMYIVITSISFVTIYAYSYSTGAISFIGSTCFFISDYIIGVENIFKVKSDFLRKLVWIFYPIGQIMIIVCR